MSIDITEDLIETRQRIFQRDGNRIAIRLEEIFWAQLDELAIKDKVKLSKLVFSILDASDAGANRASLLRSYCLARLRRDTAFTIAAENINLVGLMESCPIPAFAMTPERKVLAYNAAFAREFAAKAKELAKASGEKQGMKLVFSRPFNQTVELLKKSNRNAIAGYIGFSQGNELIQKKASFCLIDARADNSQVLVYIHPDDKAKTPISEAAG